jgi:hypothetical protein
MSIVAPTMDSGFVTLTGSLADIPNTAVQTVYAAGVYVDNPTSAPVVFTLKDVSGNVIVPASVVPPGGFLGPIELFTMPISGKPQWSGNGLVGKFWGWLAWPF